MRHLAVFWQLPKAKNANEAFGSCQMSAET